MKQLADAPFIGTEAVAAGRVTAYALRRRYAAVYPNVYVAANAEVTATVRAEAAWLWSRRRGVVAGSSAVALHGGKWVEADRPAELVVDNRHPPRGLRTWAYRLADDEVQLMGGMAVTTTARTAMDIARKYPRHAAVAMIGSLMRATKLKVADVELVLSRYFGARGTIRAKATLDFVDDGAESPRETWLRLVLVDAGFPRPETQIAVYDEYRQLVAFLDMGWPEHKVAVEYDGDHHRTDRRQFHRDIERLETLRELGWVVVRVTARDLPGWNHSPRRRSDFPPILIRASPSDTAAPSGRCCR